MLFFCIADKAAGIDNDDICLIFIIHEGIALFPEDSQHFFRIDKVLITAQ